ncbi:heavy metal translocating P-type ATPase, partial [Patescibacteria group bacterium]
MKLFQSTNFQRKNSMDHSHHEMKEMSHDKSKVHEGHHRGAMSHGSSVDYLKRFWIVTFLLVPLFLTNEMFMTAINLGPIPFSKWIGLGVATAIFSFSLVFFKHAWHEIKARSYGMMTLVSLAVGSGYIFSIVSTLLPAINAEFYLEIGTLIWVLLFGHYLEARSTSRAGDSLQEVAKLLPKKAHKLINNIEEEVDVAELVENDIVLVKPGEKVPSDGIIERGSARVDEALISGESKPINKQEGDTVVAGSICLDGSLTVRVTRVGEHSTVGQIQKLIFEAQKTKPRSQKIADKASSILTLIAGVTALLTILVWSVFLGHPFVFSLTLAITVLVIACPHALGLAIPTVTTITTSLAIKNGVFIKNLAKIETLKKADYVVFDKTGTLTHGQFGVTKIVSTDSLSENDILAVTGSLEKHSSHVIGVSIVEYAKTKGISLVEPTEFKNIAGKGVYGEVHKTAYIVGNKALMDDYKLSIESLSKVYKELSSAGSTVVFIADTKKVLGIVALSDEIKAESYIAIRALKKMNINVAMLTGDSSEVAQSVAHELDIEEFSAGVLPADKYEYVKKLQNDGHTVVMVGDGVNDAPSLT